MSTKKDTTPLPKIDLSGLRFAVVAAEWNSNITDALLDGALRRFAQARVAEDAIDVFRVPGTVELTYAAAYLMENVRGYAGIIVLGCVIRGETSHYDYVCQSVTQGVTMLNTRAKVPVIFGVLTTENEQQALDRAGGKLGNKGAEAAECAIKMLYFTRKSNEKLEKIFKFQ